MHSEQYSFTKGKSTTDAGAKLLKHMYAWAMLQDAWAKTQNALEVFCNLSKAFDFVDHHLPLLKPDQYGIRAAVESVRPKG